MTGFTDRLHRAARRLVTTLAILAFAGGPLTGGPLGGATLAQSDIAGSSLPAAAIDTSSTSLPAVPMAPAGVSPVDGVMASVPSGGTAAASVPADYSNVALAFTAIASGIPSPVFVTNARDGTNRLFIVEQRGVIRIWKSGHLVATPFLDIRSKVAYGGEQGLLGLAFHPHFKTSHKFYVYFTEKGTGNLIVAEFRASGNRAIATSYRRLLRIGHPTNTNHNGGMLAFGPGGLLYIGTGDGGGAGDTPNNAQNRTRLLGKILRIDVNGRTGSLPYRIPASNPYAKSKVFRREIWAYGLRNPWRFSFDRANSNLWIGDVGQDSFEEVDRALQSAGGGKGRNYGWHIMEGNACYDPSSGCNTSGLARPLATYDHSQGCAIIGGYVYRGPYTIMRGAYLFGDDCSGKIWSVVAGGPATQTPTLMSDTSYQITAFGESETGQLYVADGNGTIYRISATAR